MSDLPQQWPGHTSTRAQTETLLDRLRKDQDPKGAPFIGERLALALLEQAPAELEASLNKLDNEAGNELTDCILAAEESLRNRPTLVTVAFSRLAIASGAAPWVEPPKRQRPARISPSGPT
jgi:hypothetical protein